MLVTSLSQADFTLTSDMQTELPKYASILDELKAAEDNLWATYARIATLTEAVGAAGSLPAELLGSYAASRTAFIAATESWLEARKRTPAKYLPDAGKEPVPPPAIVTEAGSGLGALAQASNGKVAISQLHVVYGPTSSPKVLPLGSAGVGYIRPPRSLAGRRGGLGEPTTIIAILLGVAIVTFTIGYYIIREWQRAEVERNRSLAIQSQEATKQTKVLSQTLMELYTKCVGTSTDSKVRIKCAETAAGNLKAAIQALPKPIKPTKTGLGWFGGLALVVVTAAASVGFYTLWRRRQRS